MMRHSNARLVAILAISIAIAGCYSVNSSVGDRFAVGRTIANAPEGVSFLSEVLAIVDAQYVEPLDFARFTFGALRGIENLMPEGAFRVWEAKEGVGITYQTTGRMPTRLAFGRQSSKDQVLRDLELARNIAREVGLTLDQPRLERAKVSYALRTLDAHSAFLPPEMYREMQVETTGSFGGLGIEITLKDDILTVVAPIEGTPAYRAGIHSGDRIVKIEGIATKDMSLVDAVKRMGGKPATKVTITIMREDWPEPKDVTITREVIRVQSVRIQDLEPGIGYVRLRQFQEQTSHDLDAVLEKLTRNGRLQGLVLDLRNNPGGLLTSAVEVAEKFLEGGRLVVYTEGRIRNQNLRFTAHPKRSYQGFPMVVLVNEGSASGAEIVAGALQDWKRAVIVGRQTFGKGSIQTIIPLSDGSGLRLTTARYFTPKGRPIHNEGIAPDIVVAPPATSAPGPGLLASDPELEQALVHLKTIGSERYR